MLDTSTPNNSRSHNKRKSTLVVRNFSVEDPLEIIPPNLPSPDQQVEPRQPLRVTRSSTAASVVIDVERESKPHKKFRCSNCAKCFRTQTSLYRHTKYECGQSLPRFGCCYCTYKTKLTSGVYQHIMRMHSGSELACLDITRGKIEKKKSLTRPKILLPPSSTSSNNI